MREAAKPIVNTWNCVNCGGQIAVKSAATISVACPYCGSIVDAKDPNHRLIAEYDRKTKIQPRIPLGSRGEIRGETYECIGFLRRQIRVEGTPYSWAEYLLWHPHRGYRWLSEYNHHWVYLKPCTGLPRVTGNEAHFIDRTYKRFQSAEATVTYALGEFNWSVARGEVSRATDYVSPPYILSEDKSHNEVNWTLGEYIDIADVWKGFKLAGEPPKPEGVAPAQPSPYDSLAPTMHKVFGIFAALVVLIQMAACALCRNEQAYTESFTVKSTDTEKAKVTKSFTLAGRTSNIEVRLDTNASNNWAFFEIALVSPENDEVVEFTREVEFYSGVDGGESWSEGSRSDSVVIGTVPPGNYTMVIESDCPMPELNYTVTVMRDVPRWGYFFIGVLLLPLPYLVFLWRRRTFEFTRWSESDYPMRPLIQTSSGDDE